MYWQNPLRSNLEKVLALAVANENEHEAATARRTALKQLRKVETGDLPQLHSILQRTARFENGWPGALDKLRGIIEQATHDNPLLERFKNIKPATKKAEIESFDFESAMADFSRRSVWEAQQEAASEYSWDEYRHPWKEWQEAQDEEDDDAGYEWFARFEQPSWAESLYEEGRRAPWRFWSQSVGPKEIFDLIRDLLLEEWAATAAVGLANLRWPPYAAMRAHASQYLALEELLEIAQAFFACYQCYQHYWLLSVLIREKLRHEEPTPEIVNKLFHIAEEVGECCHRSRLAYSVLNTIEHHPNLQTPNILDPLFVLLEKTLKAQCENECNTDLLDEVVNLAEDEAPSLLRHYAAQLTIHLVVANVVYQTKFIDLDPREIIISSEWQQLQESVLAMWDYIESPSQWQETFVRPLRRLKITKLADQPLDEAIPLLTKAISALEAAAAYRENHLYKVRSPRSLGMEWIPSDRSLQLAIRVIAEHLPPRHPQILSLLKRLIGLIITPTSTKDINPFMAIMSKLGEIPSAEAEKSAEQVMNFWSNSSRAQERLWNIYVNAPKGRDF